MDWKDFFTLSVRQKRPDGYAPYFFSTLSVPEVMIEDILLPNFQEMGIPEAELGRLTLGLRKILHSLHCFNSLEFERITDNFFKRLAREPGAELHFQTSGGGIYLFLALLKHHPEWAQTKTIFCETTEMPIPVFKLPPTSPVGLRLKYYPQARSYLAGIPSLWAKPEILRLFDQKEWAQVA